MRACPLVLRRSPSCPRPVLPRGGLRLSRLLSADQAGCECPSVHWDLRVVGVEPGLPLHPSSPPASSPCPPWAAWCSALPSLCYSHFPTPGAQHFDVKPSAPFLLFLQPPPHHHLLKNGRKKKTVKRGMLTDKPPQLSEASMSVLWMFLFTS